jgi:preprotein translocase subunit SecA
LLALTDPSPPTSASPPTCVFFLSLSCISHSQANVDRNGDPAEWRLDALAGKLIQYCYLLEGLTGADLARVAAEGGGYEALNAHLRRLAVDALDRKVKMIEEYEPGLMGEAQRFFLLSQTDALWKEHLQVGGWVGAIICWFGWA